MPERSSSQNLPRYPSDQRILAGSPRDEGQTSQESEPVPSDENYQRSPEMGYFDENESAEAQEEELNKLRSKSRTSPVPQPDDTEKRPLERSRSRSQARTSPKPAPTQQDNDQGDVTNADDEQNFDPDPAPAQPPVRRLPSRSLSRGAKSPSVPKSPPRLQEQDANVADSADMERVKDGLRGEVIKIVRNRNKAVRELVSTLKLQLFGEIGRAESEMVPLIREKISLIDQFARVEDPKTSFMDDYKRWLANGNQLNPDDNTIWQELQLILLADLASNREVTEHIRTAKALFRTILAEPAAEAESEEKNENQSRRMAKNPKMYDPNFTKLERQILKSFNRRVEESDNGEFYAALEQFKEANLPIRENQIKKSEFVSDVLRVLKDEKDRGLHAQTAMHWYNVLTNVLNELCKSEREFDKGDLLEEMKNLIMDSPECKKLRPRRRLSCLTLEKANKEKQMEKEKKASLVGDRDLRKTLPHFVPVAAAGGTKSVSKQANVTFPVPRVHTRLKYFLINLIVQKGAAVVAAGALDYLIGEVLELANNAAHEEGNARIIPRHIRRGIGYDYWGLAALIKGHIAGGGVMPHIHEALLPKLSTETALERAERQLEKNKRRIAAYRQQRAESRLKKQALIKEDTFSVWYFPDLKDVRVKVNMRKLVAKLMDDKKKEDFRNEKRTIGTNASKRFNNYTWPDIGDDEKSEAWQAELKEKAQEIAEFDFLAAEWLHDLTTPVQNLRNTTEEHKEKIFSLLGAQILAARTKQVAKIEKQPNAAFWKWVKEVALQNNDKVKWSDQYIFFYE